MFITTLNSYSLLYWLQGRLGPQSKVYSQHGHIEKLLWKWTLELIMKNKTTCGGLMGEWRRWRWRNMVICFIYIYEIELWNLLQLEGDGGGNLTNVQCKPTQNCHKESPCTRNISQINKDWVQFWMVWLAKVK
jgi:hypothetical protein